MTAPPRAEFNPVMEVEVRRVRAAEWPLLCEVRLAALLDAPDAFFRTHAEEAALGDAGWQERTRTLGSSADSAGFLAFGHGPQRAGLQAVGMAGGWLSSPDTVVVWGVWVSPDDRGNGIASRLMRAVEGWARDETSAARLTLQVVDGNAPAATLYSSLGYVETGARQPFRAGSGLMESELSKPV